MPGPKDTNPADLHVGKRVRMLRIKVGTSQTALGEKLGITFQQIQKYERGINRIGAGRLQQISEALNVPVAFLFEGLPGPKSNDTNNDMTEFVEFLGTTLGQRLVEGFVKIQNKNVRAHITRLVESLADKTTPPILKRPSKDKPAYPR